MKQPCNPWKAAASIALSAFFAICLAPATLMAADEPYQVGPFWGALDSWETRHPDAAEDPEFFDDGTIVYKSDFVHDFGPNASVTIKHDLIMIGASGASGANGNNYDVGIQNPPYPGIDGVDGEDGEDGYIFNIKAGSVVFQPTPYIIGTVTVYASSLDTSGGNGGNGGHAGGIFDESRGVGCIQTIGSYGTGGQAGNGGSITIDAAAITFGTQCIITGLGSKLEWPLIRSNGGNAGRHGFNSGAPGVDGSDGLPGGDGGAIDFVDALVHACPQEMELYTLSCPTNQGACSYRVDTGVAACESEVTTAALGYMRLPISINGGRGSDGTHGGTVWGSCIQDRDDKCAVTGPKGGRGGDGGNAGTLSICNVHPVLINAAGGQGGNGGNGGGDGDPYNFTYYSRLGAGGTGGTGGAPGSGCGYESELPEGLGGFGGFGSGAPYGGDPQDCGEHTQASNGSPDPDGPAPETDVNFQAPVPGCKVTIDSIPSGQPLECDVVHTLRGKNLKEHENALELTLNGVPIQILSVSKVSASCFDSDLTFRIDRDPSGNPISCPSTGDYVLRISNGQCHDTMTVAVENDDPGPGAPGETCETAIEETCNSQLNYTDTQFHPNVDKVPCFSVDHAGFWRKVTVAPGSTLKVTHTEQNYIAGVGVAIYSSCGGTLLDEDCGLASATAEYENTTSSPQEVRVLLNVYSDVYSASVNFECISAAPDNKEYADALNINCGYSVIGPITNGASASTSPVPNPCTGQTGIPDVWYRYVTPLGYPDPQQNEPFGPEVTITFDDDAWYDVSPGSGNYHQGFIALYRRYWAGNLELVDYRCGRVGEFSMTVKLGGSSEYFIRIGSESPNPDKSFSMTCSSKLQSP